MDKMLVAKEETEDIDSYMEAFYESWEQRSMGEPNHSGSSTIEGPKKTADTLLEAFIEGI